MVTVVGMVGVQFGLYEDQAEAMHHVAGTTAPFLLRKGLPNGALLV